MSPDQPVTAAEFLSPVEADIARLHLEESGIRAFVSGDAAAVMAWHLSGAMHGVKVLVAAKDLERAWTILDNEDSAPDLDDVPPSISTPTGADETFFVETGEEDVEEIDPRVARAFRAAYLGFLFLPLHLYSLWLLSDILFSKSTITKTSKRYAWLALVLNVPIFIIVALIAYHEMESFDFHEMEGWILPIHW